MLAQEFTFSNWPTTVQLFVGSSPLGSASSVTLEPYNNPIPLTTRSGEGLYLKVEQQGEVIKDGRFRGEYRITTRSYHYAVLLDPASKDDPIIAWDWHPGTSPDHPYPHIHAGIHDHLSRIGVELESIRSRLLRWVAPPSPNQDRQGPCLTAGPFATR